MDSDGSNLEILDTLSPGLAYTISPTPHWWRPPASSAVTPAPTPAPLVFGVTPLVEQGQTNIELISEQEQLLEIPTEQFDVVSATFKQPLTSVNVLDFGVRLGMPWSGTEIEIKIRNSYAGYAEVVVTRQHVQLGVIYWKQIDQLGGGGDIFKIEFSKEASGINVKVNGVESSLSSITAIDFDFETFENVTVFVNSENKVINATESPYFSVTNFYVHNNGNVLIP